MALPDGLARSNIAGPPAGQQTTNLADILERVLDKGIVIAGDIRVNVLDIELLTIKIRLLVASVDKAREIGIDWWERDPSLTSGHRDVNGDLDRKNLDRENLDRENKALRERIVALEAAASQVELDRTPPPPVRSPGAEDGR
jgi:Gas vesicle protein